MGIITEFIIRTVASMSPEQREDMYLTLACQASDRGDNHESNVWLYHAENRTAWRQLVEEKINA